VGQWGSTESSCKNVYFGGASKVSVFTSFYFICGDGPIKWLNAKEKRKNLKGTPSN
jgi:hypothetical protein